MSSCWGSVFWTAWLWGWGIPAPESLKTASVPCKFKFHKHRMCHNAGNHITNFHYYETLLQSQSQTLLYANKAYWNIYWQSIKLMSIKTWLYHLPCTVILTSTVPHYYSFMTVLVDWYRGYGATTPCAPRPWASRPFVHRHLVPSVISRGALCQTTSESSVSEEWKQVRNVR
jgi:hypothetical protein